MKYYGRPLTIIYIWHFSDTFTSNNRYWNCRPTSQFASERICENLRIYGDVMKFCGLYFSMKHPVDLRWSYTELRTDNGLLLPFKLRTSSSPSYTLSWVFNCTRQQTAGLWQQYTLVGIPTYLVRRMQSALNAAARLIFNLWRSDHITDALVSLH